MRLLGLDVGTRKTGVSFYDQRTDIVLPLSTLHHTSKDELIAEVMNLVHEKGIDSIVVGLPLLPSGKEGSQSRHSVEISTALRAKGLQVELCDERYTTPRTSRSLDGNAAAAVDILEAFVRSKKPD
jgi:putative Holliday junction resolvase